MWLTALGLYAGASAVYWGVKYANTRDVQKKEEAVKHLAESYLKCFKWPVDLLKGTTGFDDENKEQ